MIIWTCSPDLVSWRKVMYRTVLMHRGDVTCWHAQSWRFLLSSSVCPHNKVKTWKQVQTRLLLWRSLSSENWTQPTSWNDWCSCERLVLCFDCNVAHDHTILRDLQFSLSSSWTSFSSTSPVSSHLTETCRSPPHHPSLVGLATDIEQTSSGLSWQLIY